MRSPLPTRGRNTLFENLFKALTGWRRSSVPGSQRSRVLSVSTIRRNYDLEIGEFPIRDRDVAVHLIEMLAWCPEVQTALNILVQDCLSSEDGDTIGFVVSDTLDDDETPVDPEVKAICEDLIRRPGIVGGLALERVVQRMLGYGDAFLSIGIDKEGIGRNDLGISRTLMLPTWEMFRLEADNGDLLGYQQRKSLSDFTALDFYPPQIVHFRHNRQTLYGRSMWRSSIEDWQKLKDATEDLAVAARSLGINPNVHEMPEGADDGYLEAYRSDYEARLEDGLVTDFFMLPGGDVRKLANYVPDLNALAQNVLFRRQRIIMPSQIPIWRFAGLPADGARDISGQPAKAYARSINFIRMCLTEGIKQILDTELILKLGIDEFRSRGRYQIVFPQIATDPNAAAAQVAPDEEEPTNGNGRRQQPQTSVPRRSANARR